MATRQFLMIIGAAATALPAADKVGLLEFEQIHPLNAGTSEVNWPAIEVDGTGTSRYDQVHTKSVEVWIRLWGEGRPGKSKGSPKGSIHIENGKASFEGELSNPKIYKIIFDYRDPLSQYVENSRVSPVEICNDRLNALSGSERTKFLKEGLSFNYGNAWKVRVTADWVATGLKDDYKTRSKEGFVFARIVCRPLEGPKVRTGKPTTTGSQGPGPRTQAPPPARANPPPARANPAPVRANPAATPPPTTSEAFDIRIRGANRDGFNGATQLWVYNAGPGTAQSCSLDWRTTGMDQFVSVATIGAVGAGETKKVGGSLPGSPNSEFRVNCASEPASALGNNLFALP